ncbi:hypothetical protein ANCCEY_00066 [Ancylostoma ceylanicum]|uniref:Uncharacterized protein n=1 Tax=Ancylostoma ceylanicum TaxID=53326 RepID=A0A0D6M9P2_9BILA|nr:hypothetical protein ANCCEY_00066 [Ancylostoma ceylanicum]
MAKCMPKLQFIYLRELDLEKINRATVVDLANHNTLKKVIVHGCRNYEVLEDFRNLPQLLVVRGEILGLKAMLGDFDEEQAGSSPASQSLSQSISQSISESSDQPETVTVQVATGP